MSCVMQDWKSPFAVVERFNGRYSKLVGGSRPGFLPGWHVGDMGEVIFKV